MRKQQPSAPMLEPALCNCLALRQAARHVTQFYDRHMAAEGLRSTQYSIIARLNRLGPQTINQLAASIVMDRTAMGRALRPLERDRLVAIRPGKDERTRVVSLTPAGKAKARSSTAHWRSAQKAFEAAYGASQSARLRAELAALISTT